MQKTKGKSLSNQIINLLFGVVEILLRHPLLPGKR